MDANHSNDGVVDPPLKFGRLAHTTGFLVRRLHNLLSSSWADEVQSVGAGRTTPVQAGLLILINENPGVTQARLLKALDVESATLVRSIAKLVDAGFVEKTRNPSDKRSSFLNLTAAGGEVLEEVEARMAAREAKLAEDISAADLEAFQRVLVQLIAKRSRGARSGSLDGLLGAESPRTGAERS